MSTTRTPQNLIHIPSHKEPLIADSGKISEIWLTTFTNQAKLLNSGVPGPTNNNNKVQTPGSVTLPLAKLTGGGANGSITITGGIVTAYVAPT